MTILLQDFPLEEGQAALKTAGWPDFDKVDPVKRLVINGVIVIRASAARDMIAFTLDPVAEYLAAAALIEASEHEPDGKAKMFEKVRGAGQSAKGFLFSLQQTVKLYNRRVAGGRSLTTAKDNPQSSKRLEAKTEPRSRCSAWPWAITCWTNGCCSSENLRDFAASLKDGRLFEQGIRLAASPLHKAIILEGRACDLAESGMRREALARGAY